MSDVSIYAWGRQVSLESVLLAHTDLLNMIRENGQLDDLKSYDELYVYIRETYVSKNGESILYANVICDRLGEPYSIVEDSLACMNDLQGVSFHELKEDHPEIDFRYLNLVGSNLCYCDLRNIDLSYSNLCNTDLLGADCRGTKFTGCSTDRRTSFEYAKFSGAIDVSFVPLSCPSDGEFIGWKRVQDYLVKLKIPNDAKRSSATSRACRCDKALVLGIYNGFDGSEVDFDELVVNARGLVWGCFFHQITSPITYKVGEMVYADSFDDNRWNECSHGIHFFVDYEAARMYIDSLVDKERNADVELAHLRGEYRIII
jgi:hypothetical protein